MFLSIRRVSHNTSVFVTVLLGVRSCTLQTLRFPSTSHLVTVRDPALLGALTFVTIGDSRRDGVMRCQSDLAFNRQVRRNTPLLGGLQGPHVLGGQ